MAVFIQKDITPTAQQLTIPVFIILVPSNILVVFAETTQSETLADAIIMQYKPYNYSVLTFK